MSVMNIHVGIHYHDMFTVVNCKQEAQLLLGDRATRKHAKDS